MQRAISYALASAILFGLSTPLAKILVASVSPLMLAGLLYAGSGAGLALVMVARRVTSRHPSPIGVPHGRELAWLAAAILSGGVLAPVALLHGLTVTPASTASLLLNLEAVFTALLAWFLFREHFDRRIALGMAAIVAGGILLAWTPRDDLSGGALFIAAACFGWALDNNLTRKASGSDAVAIAALKGFVSGSVNIALALLLGQALPGAGVIAVAGIVGLAGYGVSLVLFVLALRDLGSARTGAYFSIAPFFGALVGVLLEGDRVTWPLVGAGLLMALGVWLHLSERHEHEHAHEFLEHTHSHVHDEHHQHAHEDWDGREPHTHRHVHEPLVHTHPHYPDLHHRHRH